MRNKNKKINKKTLVKRLFGLAAFQIVSPGNIRPDRARIVLLLTAIMVLQTYLLVKNVYLQKEEPLGIAHAATVPKSPVRNDEFEQQLKAMVAGYPIENMVPYIAREDEKVAAFMISIAKKESNWGKRRPVLEGQDCFNYWGFRLRSERMGSGGHTCFDNPKEAVEKIAQRMEEMVYDENLSTPAEMVIWKCGYGCEEKEKTQSERKWIADVDYYFEMFSDPGRGRVLGKSMERAVR